jgi:hypothetical protein
MPTLATAARTVVAATHGGWLTAAGRPRVAVGYVDDAGEPLVLVSRCEQPPRGLACLTVPGGAGRVDLHGRLLPVPGDDDLGRLLGAHRPCFVDTLRSGPARVLRLAVEAVRLEQEGAQHQVPWMSYASAEPDLWSAFGHTVATHLSADHGDVLATVARLRLRHTEVIAAGVAGLRRGGLDLDVVTPYGASRLAIALPADLQDPHELCGRLLELLVPGAL